MRSRYLPDRRGSRLTRWQLFLALVCLLPSASTADSPSASVLQIEVHDTLQPERANVFARTVERANAKGYAAIVLNLSTPGGLSSSVDIMVDAIRGSRIPVIGWAGTPQTRVSGEGLRLLAASDISLMNSRAFLTPLWTERVHSISVERQAAGSQRLLAKLEETNTRQQRQSSSLEELASGTHWFTGEEALSAHLIDGIAEKMPDVLRFVDGKIVRRNGSTRLQVAKASTDTAHPELQELLLISLMNPDLCVLLLTLGCLLIYLEINTPGAIVPGIAGVLLVLLASYALHLLPLNKTGILLCFLSGLLLLLEARFSSHGLLASAGVLTLVTGLAALVDGPIPQLQVEWATAIGAGLGFGGVTAALIVLGFKARRAKVKTGSDAVLGWLAVAHTALDPEGQVLVRGELWLARLTTSDSFVAAGDRVKVLRADGFLLEVAAVPLGDGT